MRLELKVSSAIVIGVAIGMPHVMARGDEEKALRPEVQQMKQSVSEKIQAAADKLGLTPEQRDKIREIQAKHAEQHKAMRAERRALLQEELKALATALTPEQREKVKELAEDRAEEVKQQAPKGLPAFAGERDTLAERVESAEESIGLSDEQQEKMETALASYADRHEAMKEKCREACEEEFKEISAVLTPEQRMKARAAIELRVVRAAAAKGVSDRIDSAEKEFTLNAEQRQQLAKTRSQFAPKYRELRSQRRELLKEEMKAIGAILTPEQREMVKDFDEDRVVIIEVAGSGVTPADAAKALKETVCERLEAEGDKLELTAEQRKEIGNIRSSFADKFQKQREQRRALRQEEVKSLGNVLTEEQREKVKSFVEERT